MRQNLFTLLLCFAAHLGLFAQQQSPLDIALRHVEKHATQWNLTTSDYSEMMVSDHYSSNLSGGTYIYFNQAHEGIPLKNAILNLTINKKGEVIFVANTFVPDLKSKITTTRAKLEPADAVLAAAKHLDVSNPRIGSSKGRNEQGKYIFDRSSFTRSDIQVSLKYDRIGDQVVLVWEALMEMKDNDDYWEIRMNAADGSFVSKNNLTVYCNHHKGQYDRHDNCGVTRHIQAENHAVSVRQALTNRNGASYRVYALPAESPIHGPLTLVTNPHYPEASPFGWHDTNGQEGPEFTILRGNNVNAFADMNNDDAPDQDVTRPDGGEALLFDFPHDLSQEPEANLDIAQVNLFYMVNMMHDLSFILGFDEAAGNFQQRNYSGVGAGNDFVLAQALDGFKAEPRTLNNANFATPPDGANGRMQMYLWSRNSGSVRITEPPQLEGFINEFGAANFGQPIPSGNEPAISGNMIVGLTNSTTEPTLGCAAIINDVAGKVVMIDRGVCEFGRKVLNAQQAGAVAAVICNIAGIGGGNGDEVNTQMAGGAVGDQVTIPSILMKKSDCDRIKASINAGIPVNIVFKREEISGPGFLDASLDNGIIAHEFGHGISTRLTGGPSNSGCLGNDEQMGEGWSDFFSLVTTVRPGENGKESRGIGTFSLDETVNGRGIRRFPYSTDMNINPQTFDDIKSTTAPHPLGEVWTGMLWDLYWAMVDQYGYDEDWRNMESGNNKAIRLVMEGMRMQGCNPGFLRGRDAILGADILLYEGANNCLIWDVFARRGLGINANGGSDNDRNDGTENFESLPTCVQELKISKTATQLVEAGGDIEVTLKAINHVPGDLQTGVVITDEIPEGTSYVDGSANRPARVNGNLIIFEIGDMNYDQELTITYRLQTPNVKSNTLFIESFDNFEDAFELEFIEGFIPWAITENAQKSGLYSYGVDAPETEIDQALMSPEFTVTGQFPVLRFWHLFNTQNATDGGFVQVSVDGGSTWQYVDDKFIRNGYNTEIAYGTFAIPALGGYTGNSNGFVDSYLDLRVYRGEKIRVRFRFGTDATLTVASPLRGWYVDDFEIMDLVAYEGRACIENGDQSYGQCTIASLTFVDSEGVVSNQEVIGNDHFGLKVFPNPAAEYFNVVASSPISEEVSVKLLTVDGRVVYQNKMNVGPQGGLLNVSTHTMTPGFYILKVHNGQRESINKIVIK